MLTIKGDGIQLIEMFLSKHIGENSVVGIIIYEWMILFGSNEKKLYALVSLDICKLVFIVFLNSL